MGFNIDKLNAKCKNIAKDAKRFNELWNPLSYIDGNDDLQELVDSMKEQAEAINREIEKMEAAIAC